MGSPRKNYGLLIGGGLIVVAASVAGGILLMGGEVDEGTGVTVAPSTLATETTVGNTEVLTPPPTVALTDPVATTVPGGPIRVFDDTNTFSMIVQNDLELDTTTILSIDKFEVPSISTATVIADYFVDDVTFGLTAVVVGPEIGSTAQQVMSGFLIPPEGTCTGRVDDQVETAAGLADRILLTGCGVGGGNKVLMVVQLADRPVVIGVYMQSTSDLSTLTPDVQLALESIVVL